jgi:hypothetical protein
MDSSGDNDYIRLCLPIHAERGWSATGSARFRMPRAAKIAFVCREKRQGPSMVENQEPCRVASTTCGSVCERSGCRPGRENRSAFLTL